MGVFLILDSKNNGGTMIKIIRLHYMSILKIAGDFYIFNRRDETENCRDAANFM